MKTTWKFPLGIEDRQTVKMPKGAYVLPSAQTQFDRLTVWAIVDDKAPMEDREFRIAGTGHPLDDLNPADWKFLGTVQMMDGGLIWHVFVK